MKALKESHQDEATFHKDALDRLQSELKKIKNRIDQLYVDKLDGKVSEAFWLDKSRLWEAEQARLVSQLQAHQVADPATMTMASNFSNSRQRRMNSTHNSP